MLLFESLDINGQGHLTIGGCDAVELAKSYGTPLYVMDEGAIRSRARLYQRAMEKEFEGKGKALYASKAFCCKEICRIIRQEGMGLDVVSGGELYTALEAGFDPSRIFFHGTNKTAEEIRFGLDRGVGRFVVDNLTELKTLNDLAGEKGRKAEILLRIKPGVDAHTHRFIRTGQIDSKFGLGIEEAEHAAALSAGMKNLILRGIHCHIGSQIKETKPFEMAAEVMVDFMARAKERFGLSMDELNLGGGFGVSYLSAHEPVDYEEYIGKMAVPPPFLK